MGYVAQAAYTYTHRESVAGGILYQAATTGSDSFQQNELQCRDQCPQFAEIQNRCLLKGLAKGSESLLVEAIISHVEKCLSEGQHSRDNLSPGGRSMRKPPQRLEFCGDTQRLGIHQGDIVTKPANSSLCEGFPMLVPAGERLSLECWPTLRHFSTWLIIASTSRDSLPFARPFRRQRFWISANCGHWSRH